MFRQNENFHNITQKLLNKKQSIDLLGFSYFSTQTQLNKWKFSFYSIHLLNTAIYCKELYIRKAISTKTIN